MTRYEGLVGGLRRSLKMEWDYSPLAEFEEELFLEEKCEREVNYERFHWELNDVRRHNRLKSCCQLLYFPYMYPALRIQSHFGQFLWHVYCTNTKPDKPYLKQLMTSIRLTLPRLDKKTETVRFMILSEYLMNINWLEATLRRKFLTTLARIIKTQGDLTYITIENANLTIDSGLRVLLILSLGAGKTIERLNIWNLFRKGAMPLQECKFSRADNGNHLLSPFEFTEEDKRAPSKEERKRLWKNILVSEDLIDIPKKSHRYLFTVCLSYFENVRVLNIHFSWITYGQGKGLCQLGCVRNGNLKELHLLCTPEDLPEKTNQTISYHAWREALLTCPDLKVHLVIFCVPEYDRNKQFLCQNMPLESYHLSSGYSCVDMKKFCHVWFDCILRTLIYRYSTQLKKLSLHLWHPRQWVDSILCHCILKFHHLQTFEYSGPLDKLDTLYEICEFVSKGSLRIKYLLLYIQEDPCKPQSYRQAIEEVYKKYIHNFQNLGINFVLETYRI